MIYKGDNFYEKVFNKAVLTLLVVAIILSFAACGGSDIESVDAVSPGIDDTYSQDWEDTQNWNEWIVSTATPLPPSDDENSDINFAVVYSAAIDLGFEGTLDDLIEAFEGNNAYNIAVESGYIGSEADWVTTLVGAKGDKGDDGLTPVIGTNGNWFVGDTDTGVCAQGKNGLDGLDGKDGDKGDTGLSAYEIYKKYYDYAGTEKEWIDDLANGRLVRYTVTFNTDGGSQVSSITNLKRNDKISAPTSPTKTNQYFAGWYKDQECTNEWDFNEAITEDVTIYAKWTKVKIMSVVGGSAYIESCEYTPTYIDESNPSYKPFSALVENYRIVAVPDEGYQIKKWIVRDITANWNGGESTWDIASNVCEVYLYFKDERYEITPVFTNNPDEIIKITMHINLPQGGTVIYPEYGVKGSSFEITIIPNPGYYIQNYGYMQPDEESPYNINGMLIDIVNVVNTPLGSLDEALYLTASLSFTDGTFGKGETKEFFVNFIKHEDAIIMQAKVLNGSEKYDHGNGRISFGSSINGQGFIVNGYFSLCNIDTVYFARAIAWQGYEFSHWEDENGNIISCNENLEFLLTELADRTFYAIFK